MRITGVFFSKIVALIHVLRNECLFNWIALLDK